MEQAYNFSRGFQIKILALAWRDPSFYTIHKDVLRPQYFEDEVHNDIARIMFNYYETYKSPPTIEALMHEVQSLCENSPVKKSKIDQYKTALSDIANADLSDAEYVKDKTIEFGRRQALIQAILQSAEDLEKGRDFNKIKQRIEEASMVGMGVTDLGINYFENIAERIERTWAAPPTEKILTGIKLLDNIMDGGLARKELGVVIAPPGTGKTLTLVNLGATAVKNGYNVFHFSFEMSQDLMAKRYDMCITHKDNQYFKDDDNRKKVIHALERYKDFENRGELIIKAFPPRTCTPEMVRSFVTRVCLVKNIKPDLIILDYPDIMKPSRTYSERRSELEILYEDIRAIGHELDCAVWGASQTNRGALAKETITIADLAESFGKAAVADFMIALSQTKKEKKENRLRYYVAKHRNGRDNETVCCKIEYDKMTVTFDEEYQAMFEAQENMEDDDSPKRKSKKKHDGSDVVSETIMGELEDVEE